MSIELFRKSFILEGIDINPAYFSDNGDGSYCLTPYMIYSIARDAAEFYKSRLFDLDINHIYHTSNAYEIIDTWDQKSYDTDWLAKYGDIIKEAKKSWYNYYINNKNEFEPFVKCQYADEKYVRIFKGYTPEVTAGLKETIQAYNSAREILDKFYSAETDKSFKIDTLILSKDIPIYSKQEYVEKHKIVRYKISEDLGIPNDEFEVSYSTVETLYNLNTTRCQSLGKDDVEFKKYVEGVINFIASENSIKLVKTKINSLKSDIDNLVITFNDNAKFLSAVKCDDDSIEIYTKAEELYASIKLIRFKIEDDHYNYYFNVNELCDLDAYYKIIQTKSDIHSALDKSIELMESIKNLDKYTKDLKSVVESLSYM